MSKLWGRFPQAVGGDGTGWNGDGTGMERMSGRIAVGVGLLALSAGTAANSLLGPLWLDVVRYRYGPSMTNQGIGLDAVALLVVVPVGVVAGVLTLRRHPAGPVLGLAPAAFMAYMLPQYVIGPDYGGLPGNNERFFPFHVLMFVVAVAVGLSAWHGIDGRRLPPAGRRSDRRRSWVLAFVVAFILARWVPAVVGLVVGAPGEPGYLDNPTAYLLVGLLDLGVVVPAAAATAVALRAGTQWARTGAYAVIGWFATVPLSVAAMSLTMLLRGDPDASVGTTLVFSAAAVVFGIGAVVLYRPLLQRGAWQDSRGADVGTVSRPAPAPASGGRRPASG